MLNKQTINKALKPLTPQQTNLMPAANDYGFGTTSFGTTITNDLKPGQDESTNAVVTIELDSPNGSAKRNVSIYLNVN